MIVRDLVPDIIMARVILQIVSKLKLEDNQDKSQQ